MQPLNFRKMQLWNVRKNTPLNVCKMRRLKVRKMRLNFVKYARKMFVNCNREMLVKCDCKVFLNCDCYVLVKFSNWVFVKMSLFSVCEIRLWSVRLGFFRVRSLSAWKLWQFRVRKMHDMRRLVECTTTKSPSDSRVWITLKMPNVKGSGCKLLRENNWGIVVGFKIANFLGWQLN